MKQESPTTTLDDVIQQKPFVDASKGKISLFFPNNKIVSNSNNLSKNF